ncbi:methyl-accepting chemotaxis protein [Defluviitalea phaphyphila]|uniref:methyl-accepting chemotaxis protein n=1 Tax=Defluviitalea phaphyphila TaxID=1473580 RepID=UPI0007307469|nr:methyl-accepting chemotaxis protein [Defluviitalea phaphyphila]
MKKSIKKYFIFQLLTIGIIIFIGNFFINLTSISILYKNLIITLISMLILGIFSMRIFYLVKKDLSIIEDFLNEYSNCNFLHSIKKEFMLYEFKNLQDTIKSLRKKMQVLLYNMMNANVKLSELSNKLNDNSTSSLNSMNNISNNIKDIILYLNNVITQATENANISQNLSKTNTEVEYQCNNAQLKSKETISTIKSDITNINNVLNDMIEIEEIISKSSKNVELLKKHLKIISQMSEAITNIADQTNLLSLNASIEAAKAGNEGRSFKIVAEEIKKLAISSATTAKYIDENIANINNVINKFFDTMELSIYRTKSIKEKSKTASENLLKINEQVQDIVNLIFNISNNITNQVKSSQIISMNNNNLSDNIKNTDNIIKNIENKIITQKNIVLENSSISQNIMDISYNFQNFIKPLEDEIDKELLRICQKIALNFVEQNISNEKLVQLSKNTGISEFYITDENGVTIYSNNPLGIGFRFTNDKSTQAYDFYKILSGEKQMVVQKMRRRDIDGQIYKFAGVSRQDQKGIIQAGLSIDDIINFSAKL